METREKRDVREKVDGVQADFGGRLIKNSSDEIFPPRYHMLFPLKAEFYEINPSELRVLVTWGAVNQGFTAFPIAVSYTVVCICGNFLSDFCSLTSYLFHEN